MEASDVVSLRFCYITLIDITRKSFTSPSCTMVCQVYVYLRFLRWTASQVGIDLDQAESFDFSCHICGCVLHWTCSLYMGIQPGKSRRLSLVLLLDDTDTCLVAPRHVYYDDSLYRVQLVWPHCRLRLVCVRAGHLYST
jgi:hypothetical protein